uniref:G-protein coupled receptors family 1 profile domain-containing protein n=1 Tax=Meloidogyne incognita TaxID=6306 RepID=A0A914M3V2_MELIC
MRSITNVYMISLCLADFIYLINLTLVAASQLNEKSWPFNSLLCTIYHGTETTGKYASVMFVVLLAIDRYCAMCRSNWCARYRNYRTAIALSLCAWIFAGASASPLYFFAEVAFLRLRSVEKVHKLCIAKWPNSDVARWYITASSVLIFALPLAVIIFCYYHIFIKLREALKSCKRLKRGANSRAPYHRVTRLVLWVVIFHVLCWSPFWLFNLFSSIFRLRISTQFDRVVVNIIHLFPYINCALNPILYVAHAENFRIAFRSFFCPKFVNRSRRRSGGEFFEDSRCVVITGGGVGVGGGGRSNSMGVGGPGSSVTNGSNPAVLLTTEENNICKNNAAFLRFSSNSERALLTTSGPVYNSLSNGTGNGIINKISGGSAPSLLDCPKLPLRAYSAKHSVITIEECSSDNDGGQINNNEEKICVVTRQISRRRRSSACEQAILCGGGVAAASAVPFVGQIAKEQKEEENCIKTTEKSLLEEINTSEELPPSIPPSGKRTSICFYTIGINTGVINSTKNTQLKYSFNDEKDEKMNEEKFSSKLILDEESEKDEFI